MASIIPKIKVGLPKDREKLNLSFDCATTSNIGVVQPVMCREMVPNETFHVKTKSLVRLRPLVVPTFGRMSYRMYHTFVKYSSIWEPFNSMLSGQRYNPGSGNSYVPTAVPKFSYFWLWHLMLQYADVSVYRDGLAPENAVTFNPIGYSVADVNGVSGVGVTNEFEKYYWQLRYLSQGLLSLQFGTNRTWKYHESVQGNIGDFDYGVINLGDYYMITPNAIPKFDPDDLIPDDSGYTPGTKAQVNTIYQYPDGNTVITPDGADFITSVVIDENWPLTEEGEHTYYYCFKFKPYAKHLRQILIGLGYPANPYVMGTGDSNRITFSPFKLIAFYKSWFELFRPKREVQFTDTNCYQLIQKLRSCNGSDIDTNNDWTNLWLQFLQDLMRDTYYYLPQDYFGMSVTSPIQGNSELDFISKNDPNGNSSAVASLLPDDNGVFAMHASGFTNPLAMRMAMRLFTWANKNTVVGRSIREYLRVHFGVNGDQDIDFNGVYRIGSSKIDVQTSEVMSMAETSDATLGEYAGKGLGYGDSETFDFTAKEFGCWITLSVLVPESGYYQGYLAENRQFSKFDFFNPEFDALGFQILERGELMSEYTANGSGFNPAGLSFNTGFGLVPRYSHLKVGRNIVNGDLSLEGNYVDGAPYTFDRRLPNRQLERVVACTYDTPIAQADDLSKFESSYIKYQIKQPDFVPLTVFDNFRRIDPTDQFGDYNRIFSITDNKMDHFILNHVFEVDAIAPMKSLSSSFDTVQSDEKTSEVTHS